MLCIYQRLIDRYAEIKTFAYSKPLLCDMFIFMPTYECTYMAFTNTFIELIHVNEQFISLNVTFTLRKFLLKL